MNKICPLIYTISTSKSDEKESIIVKNLSHCLGDKCAWYVKYEFPVPKQEGCAIKHLTDLLHSKDLK